MGRRIEEKTKIFNVKLVKRKYEAVKIKKGFKKTHKKSQKLKKMNTLKGTD